MELRQLRTFVHVAELGSFSAAAERLHIAQPALSRQIQILEQELGVNLFRRHGRGAVLTEQGQLFLSRATLVLRELERAREELRGDEAILSGQVSFGMPPTVADVLSTPLIEHFSAAHPQVKLRVASGYSGHVLDWLQRGMVDIAVLYETRQQPRTIRTQPLILEQLFLIAPGNEDRSPITFADSLKRNLILPSKHHGLRIVLENFAARESLTIDPVIEVDSLPVQIDLARRNIGCIVLPLVSVFAAVEAGQLSAHPIVAPEVTRRMLIATASNRPMSAAVRRFAGAIRSQVTHLAQSGRWPGVLLSEDAADDDEAPPAAQ